MALDLTLLNDLDAMRAAGTLPPLGGQQTAGAIPPGLRPGEVGYREGATNFRGSQFARPGPGLAAARAAAGARPAAPGVASAANVSDMLLRTRAIPSVGPAVRQLVGKGTVAAAAVPIAATAGALTSGADLETASLVASNPLEFIGRGLAQLYARNAPEALGGLSRSTIEAADRFNVSAFEDSPFAFGARPAASLPSRPAPSAAPAAPAAAATGAKPTPAPEPITQIVNADGSTSYTNLRSDVASAVERGARVREITPETSRGTVSVVPGVSDAQRDQALSAAISAREFATARAIANTPDRLAQVELAEQAFDAQQSALYGRTRGARALGARRVEQVAALATAREGTKAATTKALAELLKAAPAAAKTAQETKALKRREALVDELLKDKRIDAEGAALLLAGVAPERARTEIIPSLIPGGPAQVITARGGRATETTPQKVMHVGDTVYQDGKPFVVQADGSLKAKK